MENPRLAKSMIRVAMAFLSVLGAGLPGVSMRAAEVDALQASLRADVMMLAETIGPRSLHQPGTLEKTIEYIVRRFESSGWVVNRLEYKVGAQACFNLEVEKRGTKLPDEIVIVGAHYDTVSRTPGADDNASGIAGMLALAERFSKETPERTLRFVAFANEEPQYFQTELMGSRRYADRCKAKRENVVAMLALETMAYFSDAKKSQSYPFPLSLFYPSRGDFLAIVGNRESKTLVKRVTKVFASTGVLPVESASLPGKLQGVGWSDHWSFWQEGYQAVMVTDTAPFRNPNYHKSTDTVDTLDFVRFAAAVRGLEVVVKDLVTGEAANKK